MTASVMRGEVHYNGFCHYYDATIRETVYYASGVGRARGAFWTMTNNGIIALSRKG